MDEIIEKSTILVNVSKELKMKVKIKCAQDDRNITDTIITLLKAYTDGVITIKKNGNGEAK